jgi:hypothetical protein
MTRPCNFSRYALISDDLSDNEIKGQYTSTALTLKLLVQIAFQTSISANFSVLILCSDIDMDLQEERWGADALE